MKKVLCLIDTLGFGGGAERQMAGLAGMLYKQGYNVSLATYHKHDYNVVLKEKYGVESVLIECNNKIWNKFFAVRRFVLKGNFDTIIVYKDGATMMACILKFLGFNFNLIVSERNTTTKLTIREYIKFILYKSADIIVPNSYSQGKFIRDNFPKLSTKTKVITNFTDINEFTPKDFLSFDNCLKILVTARIAPQKNIIHFLNVVYRLKREKIPVQIIWYGSVYSGMEEYGKKIKEYYNKLNIEDYLEFRDATKNIVDAYRQCDVFCLPSLHEGFPNVVCEAMSCGKPILCSNICDNPFIVEDGVNGWLFNPLDEDDIFSKIRNVCSMSKSKIIQIGELNRKTAESKFSEKVFIQQYIELLEKFNYER